MILSKALLRDYLSPITVSYFARNNTPPEAMDDYGPFISDIRRRAQKENRTDEFRMTLDYVLAHPEIRLREILTLTFPYSNAQLLEIVAFVREYLYPYDAVTPPEQLQDAVLE